MSKTKKIAYAITDKNITVNYEGQTHIVPRSDQLSDLLIQALREGKSNIIPELISNSKKIEKYGQGEFVVKDGLVHVNGLPLNDVLSRKILKFQSEKLPYKPLVRFAEKIQKNPSCRAINELFIFLERNDHPITEDGNFIAYKRVNSDFTDIYTSRIDNSPGATPEMPRNAVDDNCTRTCSNGLHVANWHYAYNCYGNKDYHIMLEVEVNPSDVVSIPIDYDFAKMRVCKYKVLGVVDSKHSENDHLRMNKVEANEHCCADPSCDETNCDSMFGDTSMYPCDYCGEPTEKGYDLCVECEDLKEDEAEYPFERDLD